MIHHKGFLIHYKYFWFTSVISSSLQWFDSVISSSLQRFVIHSRDFGFMSVIHFRDFRVISEIHFRNICFTSVSHFSDVWSKLWFAAPLPRIIAYYTMHSVRDWLQWQKDKSTGPVSNLLWFFCTFPSRDFGLGEHETRYKGSTCNWVTGTGQY